MLLHRRSLSHFRLYRRLSSPTVSVCDVHRTQTLTVMRKTEDLHRFVIKQTGPREQKDQRAHV